MHHMHVLRMTIVFIVNLGNLRPPYHPGLDV